MIDVAVLGSTGSIGTQTLEVIATEPERFRISALSAHGSVELIAQQAAEVHPDVVVITDESRAADLAGRLPVGTTLDVGPAALEAAAPAGDTHAWHLFVLRLTDAAKVSRDAVIQQLSDAGIGTSVHYVPLHRQPYWRDRYGLAPEQFPQADKAYQRMFSIPLFTAMSDADQERIIAALRQILA